MLELTKDNFINEVVESADIVLVDFWNPSCTSCINLIPYVNNLEERYGKDIKFKSLNTTGARRLAISQKIMALPTIAIYRNGEKIDSLVSDEATPESIEELLKKYIS